MTYIEALACGLPVFARYDDVLKDLVIEEDSGFLFETPQEFAEKLTDFMHRSAEERKAFSRRALSKIVKIRFQSVLFQGAQCILSGNQ